MRFYFRGAAAAALLVSTLLASAARADGFSVFEQGPTPTLLQLSWGAFAPLDPPGERNRGVGSSPMFEADAISGWSIVNLWGYLIVNPYVGGFVTGTGGGMGYGGIHGTVPIGKHFEADPYFGVGAYARGSGRDMGGTALFQTGLQLFYVFDSGFRAGFTFSHESNATLLPRESGNCVCNPGANNFMMTVGVPILKMLNF